MSDKRRIVANKLYNKTVLGGIEELNEVNEELCLVISIGDPKIKQIILNKITNPNIHYPSIVHPNASISKDDVKIGKGCIIC